MLIWTCVLIAVLLGIIGLSVLKFRRGRAGKASYILRKDLSQWDPVSWNHKMAQPQMARPPAPPRPPAARDPFLMQLPGELDAIVKGLTDLKQGREELVRESDAEEKVFTSGLNTLEERLINLEQSGKAALEAMDLRLCRLERGRAGGGEEGKADG